LSTHARLQTTHRCDIARRLSRLSGGCVGDAVLLQDASSGCAEGMLLHASGAARMLCEEGDAVGVCAVSVELLLC
jgi:hypothetical protein